MSKNDGFDDEWNRLIGNNNIPMCSKHAAKMLWQAARKHQRELDANAVRDSDCYLPYRSERAIIKAILGAGCQ